MSHNPATCQSAARIVDGVHAPQAGEPIFHIGDRVFFWSGRGSQGYGIIRAIRNGRAFIDPDPVAIKGSDFRIYAPGSNKRDFWGPRDFGLPLSNLNTPPDPWFEDS